MFSDRMWQQLVGFGPEGFPAYARLRFLPDPAYEGQSEDDIDVHEDAPTETAQLRAALQMLTRHTRTAEDCYFCLWDGWGSDIQGGGGVFIADWQTGTVQTGTVRPGPRVAPAFPPSVLRGPKVVTPNRAYYLFRGQCPTSATGEQPRSGRANPDCICPTLHSSGRPTTPGASPTTSTRTGRASEPTSRPSTSFWPIHVSTSSHPTHARTSPPTGRQRKGPSSDEPRWMMTSSSDPPEVDLKMPTDDSRAA
jgi:hypothetical protein